LAPAIGSGFRPDEGPGFVTTLYPTGAYCPPSRNDSTLIFVAEMFTFSLQQEGESE